jgi:hypothetical protein
VFRPNLEESGVTISPLLILFTEYSIMSVPTEEKVDSEGASPVVSKKDQYYTSSANDLEDVAMRHIWRKLDTHLLPLVSLLELLSFL